MPFQCWSISPTLRDQHHKKITWPCWPSLHSQTDRGRSGRRQKTRWSDVFSLQMWQGIGLGRHLYWLVLNQQFMLHHFEHWFNVKRGLGLEEAKMFSTCGRLRVCASGCWNIRDHRFSRMLPFNCYRPPRFEGYQWFQPDVLHLSTDFSCCCCCCCCCCCRPHSTNVLPAESSTRIMWQPTVSPPRWQGKAPLCRDSSRGPG